MIARKIVLISSCLKTKKRKFIRRKEKLILCTKKRKFIRRKEKLILCTKYYHTRVFGFVIINAALFLSSWNVKYFISLILRAGFHRIKSNIANCRMCLVERKKKKKKAKIKTQNEKKRLIFGVTQKQK